MAQFARPDSDIDVGSWTTSPLYAKIDEATYDDGDYIQASGVTSTCEVGLSNVTDPSSSADHILRFRARYVTTAPKTFAVGLYQGATRIALNSVTLTTSFAEYIYTLTSLEANAITDYSDLRLQIGVARITTSIVQVSWAELEVPTAAAGSVYEAAVTFDRAQALGGDTPDFYFTFDREVDLAVSCELISEMAVSLGRVATTGIGGGVVVEDAVDLGSVLTSAWLGGYMPAGYTALIDLIIRARTVSLTLDARTRALTIGSRTPDVTVGNRTQDLTIEGRT